MSVFVNFRSPGELVNEHFDMSFNPNLECLLSFQDDICMHLTNYAVNKHSKDFIRDEETGSKR